MYICVYVFVGAIKIPYMQHVYYLLPIHLGQWAHVHIYILTYIHTYIIIYLHT